MIIMIDLCEMDESMAKKELTLNYVVFRSAIDLYAVSVKSITGTFKRNFTEKKLLSAVPNFAPILQLDQDFESRE